MQNQEKNIFRGRVESLSPKDDRCRIRIISSQKAAAVTLDAVIPAAQVCSIQSGDQISVLTDGKKIRALIKTEDEPFLLPRSYIEILSFNLLSPELQEMIRTQHRHILTSAMPDHSQFAKLIAAETIPYIAGLSADIRTPLRTALIHALYEKYRKDPGDELFQCLIDLLIRPADFNPEFSIKDLLENTLYLSEWLPEASGRLIRLTALSASAQEIRMLRKISETYLSDFEKGKVIRRAEGIHVRIPQMIALYERYVRVPLFSLTLAERIFYENQASMFLNTDIIETYIKHGSVPEKTDDCSEDDRYPSRIVLKTYSGQMEKEIELFSRQTKDQETALLLSRILLSCRR